VGAAVMTVGRVGPFVIENEIEADEYLGGLLQKPEYRSMHEVHTRAQKFIKDDYLKSYFINKAKELLET
jgi:hypothetical protein